MSTLLAPGLLPPQLRESEKKKLRQLFEKALDQQDGVVGYGPGILEDADNTAQALMALQDLGKPANPERMVENFQTDSYSRTYKVEGSPSFSANCHVVLSLLGYSELHRYKHHIEKALTFLLRTEELGPISDKWNLSPQYCRMLFMQTLLSVLKIHDSNRLESIPTIIIYEQIPGSICHLLSQTLLAQRSDGSWADSLKVTAYSSLTTAHCLSFIWAADLEVQLKDSILRGRQYLRTAYGTTDKHDYLWIEKVSYQSSLLHSTYCSAALNIELMEHRWSGAIVDCFSLPSGVSKQMEKLLSSLPLFQKLSLPSVDLIAIEAGQVAKRVRGFRDTLFIRDDIPMTPDKYVDFIPMIWVACNHKSGHILPANIVWEMVLLSLINFQMDEYMESIVARIAESELPMLMSSMKTKRDGGSGPSDADVDAMIHERHPTGPVKKRKMDGVKAKTIQNGLPLQNAVAQAFEALSRSSNTSPMADNTTIMGSVKRDAEECNLNSLNFPEFQGFSSQGEGYPKANGSGPAMNGSSSRIATRTDGNGVLAVTADRDEQESHKNKAKAPNGASAKDDLMAIAEFERSCVQLTLETLIPMSPLATMHKLQVFINVTDTFGHIYVQRDIASRV